MERRAEDTLFEYVRRIIYEEDAGTLDIDSLPEDLQDLGRGLMQLAIWLKEAKSFATALAEGDLSQVPPPRENAIAGSLKALHATMNHIVWQAKQVTKGDYSQRIDFMGEMAQVFNEMTDQLQEKTDALQQSMDNALRSRNLFKSILEQMQRYVLTIHNDTGKQLYYNTSAKQLIAENQSLAAQLLQEAIKRGVSEEEDARTEEIKVRVFDSREHDFCNYYYTMDSRYVLWEDEPATIHLIQDISHRRRAELEMETLAFVDTMTGLHNRHYIMPVVEQWLEHQYHFCVSFIDLDHLKQANDEFGHDEGDRYIEEAAALIKALPGDKEVARVGGDEFLLLMRDQSEEQVTRVLEDSRRQLLSSRRGENSYVKAYSYGVVEILPDDGRNRSDILREADRKMYKYKIAYKPKFSRTEESK